MKKALVKALVFALAVANVPAITVGHTKAANPVNTFVSDGKYTYYYQADGTPMKNRLTYHPDGKHVIYFDENGHEVFDSFTKVKTGIGGDDMGDDAYCYFDTNGYMYVNTVTYDLKGEKLYYINPYGLMEHNGWFGFYDNAGYGNSGKAWELNASHIGFANYDGTLSINELKHNASGMAYYLQGNGEGIRRKSDDKAIAKTTLGFFNYVGAKDALDVLNASNDISEYTHLTSEDDATYLDNAIESLDFIDECNALRSRHGLDALKVTDYMMAVSEVQGNASAITMNHTQEYSVGENLAWGYSDPFAGWYDEEKKEYDAGNTNFSEVGHYLNIINEGYGITGFSVNHNGEWSTTHEQSFDWGDEDDSAYTVAEYRARLLDYYNQVN